MAAATPRSSPRRPRPADPGGFPGFARIRAWPEPAFPAPSRPASWRSAPTSTAWTGVASGRSWSPFEGAVTCVRFAEVVRFPRVDGATRRRRATPPWPELDSVVAQLPGRTGLPRRRGRHPRPDRRRQGLPGQPLPRAEPPAAGRRRPATACTTSSPRATPRRTPAWCDVPEAGLDVVSASPELFLRRDGDRRRVPPDQGHRADAGGDAAQGLRRERHDRRPGPQRPGARLPSPAPSRSTRCAPPRSTRGWSTSSPTVSRAAAAGRAAGPRSSRRHVPAGLGVRAPEVHGAAGHRRPRAGAARPVLRRRRLGRRRRGGEAELAVGIRTFWADRDADGRRWLRFGTGAGITWGSDPGQEWARDRAEGGASGRTGIWQGRVMSDDVRVWVNGALVEARRAGHRRARPRGDRRRRRVRDLQGRWTARSSR